MKSQPVEILDSAEPDLRNAQSFYASWRSDGASAFLEKFLETAEWIEWNPELFPIKYGQIRRAVIRKSYFAIFYIIESKKSLIVAVLDIRQNPATIHATLGQRWQKQ